MEQRLIGKVISRRFRVDEIIGHGGMAIVYRAFDLRAHQTVAVKVLREEYGNDQEYRERFAREAEACRKLHHPNIVNLIDTGDVGNVHYIVLEYVDGMTLKDIIRQKGPLPQELAVKYTLDMLAALGHAHQHRVIHRDIKSQNMLVSRNGQLKVADFGIAGIADTQTLSTDGSVIGSVHYMSPEQAAGKRATEASDLYSVGVIFYEMLTGHVPFDGETITSIAMLHMLEEAPPAEQQVELTRANALILKKALFKIPEKRYTSAEDMARDLRRGLRHPDGNFMVREIERMKQSAAQGPEGRLPRASAVLKAVAAALVVLTLLAGWNLYRMLFVLTTIPNIAGVDRVSAERLIDGAGLTADFAYEISDQPEGTLLGTVPIAGSSTKRGETIVVRVSQGTGLHAVPSLIGLSTAEAMERMAAAGFKPGEVREVVSEVLKGLVVEQEPAPGTQLSKGASVSFSVSVGVVVVPDLEGLREEEALQRIEQVGLSVGEITPEQVRSASQDGKVIAQSLPAFMNVEPGEVISLAVGRYPSWGKTQLLELTFEVPEEGSAVRVTLLDEGAENEMYAARLVTPGTQTVTVQLRSDTAGLKRYRIYVDSNLCEEHEITFY